MKRERIYVTAQDRITVYENNLVSLKLADGTVLEPLEPRRLFPVNLPDQYITLLDVDEDEAAVIRDLKEIDKDSGRVIEDSLEDYYLVPTILRILAVTEKYGTLRWNVETDRGIKSFYIRNRNHDIRVARDGSVRVRDADDNRYIIRDWHELDATSKKLMIGDL